jgi:hypothetical protein
MLVLFGAHKFIPCKICRHAYEMPLYQLSRIGIHRFMSYSHQTRHNIFHISDRNCFTKSTQLSRT